jgi:GNAT superfamily N-acetyltransferase
MSDLAKPSSLSVTRLTDAQERAVGEMLGRAFAFDPIFVYVEPDPSRRASFLAEFMSALTRRSHRLAEAWVTAPEVFGASLWKGPDLRTLSAEQLAMTGLDRIPEWLSPTAAARFDEVFDRVEAALEEDAPEPVYYLGVLGVAPERRGRGVGSRLMAPVLDRADREGLSVTLETANPHNLPLYRRHGFEVKQEVVVPTSGGPTVWTMKRNPRG